MRYTEGNTQTDVPVETSAVRGLDDVDKVEFVPSKIFEAWGGRLFTRCRGWRRVITVDFGVIGVIESETLHAHLLKFVQLRTRKLLYLSERGLDEVAVTPTRQTVEAVYSQGCSLGKQFVAEFTENAIRTAWSVTAPTVASAYVCYRTHVRVDGTLAVPEVFRTNSGKLSLQQTAEPFPDLSLGTYAVSVFCHSAQYQTGTVTLVNNSLSNIGDDLAFRLYHSATGPSGDGFYYADITIGLRAK